MNVTQLLQGGEVEAKIEDYRKHPSDRPYEIEEGKVRIEWEYAVNPNET